MKKTILVPLFTILFLSIKAQDEGFTGVGIFKVKTDTTVLYDYAKSMNMKLKDVNGWKKFENEKSKGKSLLRLHFSDNDKYYVEYEKCPDVKEYYLPNYQIGNVKFDNIRLLYYRGLLQVFTASYNQDAMEVIEKKYGKIETRHIYDTVKCVYSTGVERMLSQHTQIKEKYWGLVTLTSNFSDGYDLDCNKSIISSFKYELSDSERDKCHWAQEIPVKKIKKSDLDNF